MDDEAQGPREWTWAALLVAFSRRGAECRKRNLPIGGKHVYDVYLKTRATTILFQNPNEIIDPAIVDHHCRGLGIYSWDLKWPDDHGPIDISPGDN